MNKIIKIQTSLDGSKEIIREENGIITLAEDMLAVDIKVNISEKSEKTYRIR